MYDSLILCLQALAEGRLPAGIPAPPVPSGHAVQPSPDHGHLPAGSWHGKGPAVLQTIFSPVFRLTPELGHRLHEAEQAEPSQDLEARDDGEAQHTEGVERQADRERAGLAQVDSQHGQLLRSAQVMKVVYAIWLLYHCRGTRGNGAGQSLGSGKLQPRAPAAQPAQRVDRPQMGKARHALAIARLPPW